jgi:hypothetical protein
MFKIKYIEVFFKEKNWKGRLHNAFLGIIRQRQNPQFVHNLLIPFKDRHQ